MLSKIEINFKRYSECAKAPLGMTINTAGNDLFLSETKIVKARLCELIRTDLQMQIHENHDGERFGRTGFGLSFALTVHTGITDSDFRGDVCDVVFNNSDNDYKILSGARIAQLLIRHHERVKVIEISKLTSTKINLSGFGSTGKF